jgi:hypothetical protein
MRRSYSLSKSIGVSLSQMVGDFCARAFDDYRMITRLLLVNLPVEDILLVEEAMDQRE